MMAATCAVVEHVEPATDERIARRAEIDDLRRVIELAREPRLDRVLVGRGDVHEMIDLQRADMIRDGIAIELRHVLRPGDSERDDDHDAERDAGVEPRERERIAQARSGLGGLLLFPQRGLDARLEEGRGREVRRLGADELDELFLAGQFRLALGATGEMFLQFQAGRQIELAIAVSAEESCGFVVVHGADSFSRARMSSSRSRPLARASRDMTVPMGMPTMEAISL